MHLLDFTIIIFLIAANGFLAMTEFAIISSNRNRIKLLAKTSNSAKAAQKLMENPGEFLSTIQIGITVIGVISGAFSGQKFAEPLGKWLDNFYWTYGYGETVSFALIVLMVTYASLVIGELVPKRIALSNPEKIACISARTINILNKIVRPFVILLEISTRLILKLFGQNKVNDSLVTKEDIRLLIEQGFEGGVIDLFERQLFQRVMKFNERDASIMMTPRLRVISLDLGVDNEINRKKILQHPHRYYPVFETKRDIPLGVVDIKDVLAQQMRGEKFSLSPLIIQAPCVGEEAIVPEILDQFKKKKTHLGFVTDEHGAMQGIISLTDLFETLAGEVPDLKNRKPSMITERKDGSWLCDGSTPIDDIEDLLDMEIVSSFKEEDFSTLAGFLLIQFKHIPHTGEIISWEGVNFEVVDLDGNRIDKVLIQKINEQG